MSEFEGYYEQANTSLVRQRIEKYDADASVIPGAFASDPEEGTDIRGLFFRREGATGVYDEFYAYLKNTGDDYNFEKLLTNRRRILSGEASLTLTDAMSGALILMDDATQAFVLPAITAANVGVWFEFISTVAATTTTITAGAADLLTGTARISSTTAGGDDSFHPDVSDDLIMTMNGTTQGGMIGSRAVFTAISTTRWLVNYEGVGSGTLVTPFS